MFGAVCRSPARQARGSPARHPGASDGGQSRAGGGFPGPWGGCGWSEYRNHAGQASRFGQARCAPPCAAGGVRRVGRLILQGLGFGTMLLERWRPAGAGNNLGVFHRCMARPMPSSVRDGGPIVGDLGEQRCWGATANLPTRNSPCKHPRAGADLKPCAPDHTHQSTARIDSWLSGKSPPEPAHIIVGERL